MPTHINTLTHKQQTAQNLRNTLPCYFISWTPETINADESIKFLPFYHTNAKKKHASKEQILPLDCIKDSPVWCLLLYLPWTEQGGWEWRGGDTAVTPSIRDSMLMASFSCPPSSLLISSPKREHKVRILQMERLWMCICLHVCKRNRQRRGLSSY